MTKKNYNHYLDFDPTVREYALSPDKFVFPFIVKEKAKERQIITYNSGEEYGVALRRIHEKIALDFFSNFCDRNVNSFAYHKNIRTLDALQSHLKSTHFIKLDVHHFFESITESTFFEIYGDRFNSRWRDMLSACFYKDTLSIGFVTSPVISDYFMSNFDDNIEKFLSKNRKLHYSRYCDDILISSEEETSDSLEELFEYIKKELGVLHLELNSKKTKRISLSLDEHNSISFLGLAISRLTEDFNKITISKRYILFLLQLIKKNNRYQDSCKGLLDEINSRVGYLYYNSPISFERFQRKYENIYGKRYNFIAKKPVDRKASDFAKEIPNWDEYLAKFKLKLHGKAVDSSTGAIAAYDSVILEKYIGTDTEVVIPKFVDAIGRGAFSNSKVKKVVFSERLKSIGDEAFAHSDIEEIELPAKLRTLGSKCFWSTKKLKSIIIPNKIRKIPSEAFRYSSLENITLPNGLVEIQTNAFEYSNLKAIEIPDTVEKIGESCFRNCHFLEHVELSNNLVVVEKYTFAHCGSLKEINLPLSVLSLDALCFECCTFLKEIYIHKNIVNIDHSAFDDCKYIEKIVVDKDNPVFDSRENCNSIIETASNKMIIRTEKSIIPDSIEVFGIGLFHNSRIKEITLPKGFKIISPLAFSNCSFLKKVINLSDDLKIIGSGAFKDCISLEEFDIGNNVNLIASDAFHNCINLRKFKLPNSIKRIEKNAFKNVRNIDFEIPNQLEKLGKNAFAKCYGIKKLYIPASLQEMGAHPFSGCAKTLESIEVDKANPVYTSRDNTNTIILNKTNTLILGCKNSVIDKDIVDIENYAFEGCDSLKEITFPNNLRNIGRFSFAGCSSLEKAEFYKLYSIGASAFENCKKLKIVVLPDSLDTIEDNAFAYCASLEAIDLPNSVVHFGKNTFMFCDSLKSIKLPSSFVDPFDYSLFLGCNHVETIEVSEANDFYTSSGNCLIYKYNNLLVYGCGKCIIPSTVENISCYAFANCQTLDEVVIPESVKSIYEKAFYKSSIRSVLFETKDNDESLIINASAFEGCINLEKVTLPKSRHCIQNSAFASCLSLESIKLNSRSDIGDGCFSNCRKLKDITLPHNLYSIPRSAFEGTSIQSINLSNVKSIGSHAFFNCKYLESVEFSTSSLDVCSQNASHLSIGNYAFSNCCNLKSVDLSNTTSIGIRAFSNCSNLSEVKLCHAFYKDEKNNVEPLLVLLNDYAFENCSSLKNIDFQHVSEIGSYCFKNAPLENVIFNEYLQVLRSHAFENNQNIEKVLLPANLIRIDDSPFYGCKNLKELRCDSGNNKFIVSNDAVFEKNGIWDKVAYSLVFATNSTKEIDINGSFTIRSEAFAGLDICEIDIPDNCQSIGNKCFKDCINLAKVKLPSSLSSVSAELFNGCKSLTNVKIPEEITVIGADAFKGCPLETVEIPAKVISISNTSYSSTDNLKTIKVSPNNERYYSLNDNLLLERYFDKVLLGTKQSQIPEGVLSIGSGAFKDLSIDRIELPNSTIDIASGAFENSKIKSIKFGKNIDTVLGNSFLGCEELSQIELDENNPFYYVIDNKLIKKSYDELTLCNNNPIIVDEARLMHKYCFSPLKTIDTLIVPEHMTSLDISSFENLNINKIKVDDANPLYDSRDNSNSINSKLKNKLLLASNTTVIPETIVSIAGKAFKDTKELKHIFIPKNVRAIEFGLFGGVETIDIDKNNLNYAASDKFNYIIAIKANRAIWVNEKLGDIPPLTYNSYECRNEIFNIKDRVKKALFNRPDSTTRNPFEERAHLASDSEPELCVEDLLDDLPF